MTGWKSAVLCFFAVLFLFTPPALSQICEYDFICGDGEYCEKFIGDCGGLGNCMLIGDTCTEVYDPVCGCDGVTFSNSGCAATAGINIDYSGECDPSSVRACTGNFDCFGDQYCKKALGDCGGIGTCKTIYEDCAAHEDLVCGCDGATYSNSCYADRAGMSIAYSDECAPSGPVERTVCASGCDHDSIQAAIDASSGGDTVLVHDGTYVENIDFVGKAITVRSVNGAASTTIDGAAAGSVVTFNSWEVADSVLDGFTVTGGTGTLKAGTSTTYQGGGIYVDGSSPTIRNCTVTFNSAARGGGIYLNASSSSIEYCTISDNTGNGVYAESSSLSVTGSVIDSNQTSPFNNWGGGVYGSDVSLTLSNTTLSGNIATADGGGLYLTGPSVAITGCTISGNSSSKYGGGLYVTSPSLSISGTSFTGNTTEDRGGGAHLVDSVGTVTDCLFDSNQSTGGFGYGGGLYVDHGAIDISGCTVTSNSADDSGGGIGLLIANAVTIRNCEVTGNSAAEGAGIHDYGTVSAAISDSRISSNTATGDGGGLYIDSSATTVERTRIEGNEGNRGGGVFITGNLTNPEITNLLVAGNDAYEGGGVFIDLFADPLFTNVTISGNRAVFTGGIHLRAAYATTVNSVIWGNLGTSNGLQVALASSPPAPSYSTLDMSYSVLEGGDVGNGGAPWPGSGNGVADPLFVNARPPSEAPATGGNYRVLHGSSCRSTGTDDTGSYPSLPADDIGGASRPGGAGYEIGAYEWRAGGDWDADDRPDILWSDYSGGLNYLWYMNGAAFSVGATLPSVAPSSWTAKALADFNGDGSLDILWRNYGTGEICIWYMDGETFSSSARLPTIVNTLWIIEAADDFDGDGDPDILWRYGGTGNLYLWFLDGGVPAGGELLGRASLGWTVGGTGDFDGDGDTDILWRNGGTGENYLWFLDGTAVVGGAAVQTVANLDWTVAGTADFDDDGDPDILWRDTVTGQNYLWYMDGSSAVGGSALPGVAALWRPLL